MGASSERDTKACRDGASPPAVFLLPWGALMRSDAPGGACRPPSHKRKLHDKKKSWEPPCRLRPCLEQSPLCERKPH